MWCARPGWKRCGGRPGCSTRRRSLAITSGVTGRRGSRDSVGSAASPRSTCGRRHAGRDAAQSEEDVNDNRIEDRSAVLLADLLSRYRRVWVRRHARLFHVLHWQQAGTVWAVDYARPPLPLEGRYTDLLAVRDLAGGMQLLWLPVAEATAATTAAALLSLFMLYGAPLVLKADNGSPFVAGATRELLGQGRTTWFAEGVRPPGGSGAGRSCSPGGAARRPPTVRSHSGNRPAVAGWPRPPPPTRTSPSPSRDS